MSDTTVTTQAPANTPAPVANETPINPAQPSSPNPITNTPPEAPAPDRQVSRREAIKAAFDRATAQQDGKPAPAKADPAKAAKPADAKPGHNQPPEATEAEKPKLNLKKRPDAQDPKALESDPQPRDRGRFAPRQQQDPAQAQPGAPGEAPASPQAAKPKHAPLPDTAPFRDAPARMTEAAKADWHGTPETVRGDIHRIQGEFEKAYQGYRGIAEAYKPIARFDQMAREHGTTLEAALTNYTSMEQKLRADVVGGLDVIINNLNIRSPDGKQIGLRDIAYHVLSQSPEQLKQVQQGNAQAAAGQQIGALHQEIQGLKQQLQAMHSQQQFTYTRAQVDQFADSHPRFDELGAEIKAELELGFDLETAYRRAELLKPAAANTAAQTRSTAPQTRAPADRSISGSPGSAAPSGPAPRNPAGKPTGRREAIANAIRRVNGGG